MCIDLVDFSSSSAGHDRSSTSRGGSSPINTSLSLTSLKFLAGPRRFVGQPRLSLVEPLRFVTEAQRWVVDEPPWPGDKLP
jgi:hypothetical protein